MGFFDYIFGRSSTGRTSISGSPIEELRARRPMFSQDGNVVDDIEALDEKFGTLSPQQQHDLKLLCLTIERLKGNTDVQTQQNAAEADFSRRFALDTAGLDLDPSLSNGQFFETARTALQNSLQEKVAEHNANVIRWGQPERVRSAEDYTTHVGALIGGQGLISGTESDKIASNLQQARDFYMQLPPEQQQELWRHYAEVQSARLGSISEPSEAELRLLIGSISGAVASHPAAPFEAATGALVDRRDQEIAHRQKLTERYRHDHPEKAADFNVTVDEVKLHANAWVKHNGDAIRNLDREGSPAAALPADVAPPDAERSPATADTRDVLAAMVAAARSAASSFSPPVASSTSPRLLFPANGFNEPASLTPAAESAATPNGKVFNQDVLDFERLAVAVDKNNLGKLTYRASVEGKIVDAALDGIEGKRVDALAKEVALAHGLKEDASFAEINAKLRDDVANMQRQGQMPTVDFGTLDISDKMKTALAAATVAGVGSALVTASAPASGADSGERTPIAAQNAPLQSIAAGAALY